MNNKEKLPFPNAKESDTVTLYVTGFPTTYKDEDLKTLFEKYGEVAYTTLVTKGKLPMYGFVSLKTKEQATAAIEALNNSPLEGKTLTVELSNRPRYIRENDTAPATRTINHEHHYREPPRSRRYDNDYRYDRDPRRYPPEYDRYDPREYEKRDYPMSRYPEPRRYSHYERERRHYDDMRRDDYDDMRRDYPKDRRDDYPRGEGRDSRGQGYSDLDSRPPPRHDSYY